MTLTDFQQELCTTSSWDFSDLKAPYVNCTLKPSPEMSHTQGLLDVSLAIMAANGLETDLVRAVDHDLAPGVWPDMREHGAERGDWPVSSLPTSATRSRRRHTRAGSAKWGRARRSGYSLSRCPNVRQGSLLVVAWCRKLEQV